MNVREKKEPKAPLRIPLDFEEVLADLLTIKPPPERTPDSGKKVVKKISKKISGKK